MLNNSFMKSGLPVSARRRVSLRLGLHARIGTAPKMNEFNSWMDIDSAQR